MLKYITVNKPKKRKMDGDTDDGAKAQKVFMVSHVKGDLFQCASEDSLAHCISADVHMGKGIAAVFKQKFGGVKDIQKQNKKTGEVAILTSNSRFIYYLVTKDKYWQKPTYATLRSSLEHMRSHCKEHQVRRLAMPKIGCGLDRLQWSRVEDLLTDIFHGIDIQIIVYSL